MMYFVKEALTKMFLQITTFVIHCDKLHAKDISHCHTNGSGIKKSKWYHLQ